MIVQNNSGANAYGYGLGRQAPGQTANDKSVAEEKRQDFSTDLLPKLDDRAYKAFINSTAEMDDVQKKEAAKALERIAAASAANQYAQTHDVSLTSDMSVIYDFFENYNDIVSTDQIKHLLNSRLADFTPPDTKTLNVEAFIDDYMAQLGGTRALDIRV